MRPLLPALFALGLGLSLLPVRAETPPPATAPASTLASPATAPRVPAPLRLKYTVQGEIKGLPYRAGGSLTWQHDGRQYDARLEMHLFLIASRSQHSQGLLGPEGLQPLRFTDRVRKDRVVEFDRQQGRLRFSEGTAPVALEDGVQDQLSVFMELGRRLAAQPALHQPGTSLRLPVAGVHGPDTWQFVVDGPERLQLPGGEQQTLKLTRLPPRPDALRAELWLAPALGWLPARIRLTQGNGDVVDQQWRGSETP